MQRRLGLCLALAAGLAGSARAERLPTNTAPSHYDLSFDVDLTHARFDGIETIRVANAAATDKIVLHAAEISFREVTIASGGTSQKARVTLDPGNQTATLTVPRSLPAGPADVHVRYSGILNNDLRGLYLSRANGRRYAVSQLESTDARRMFPSFDEPTYKATFSVSVNIDRNDTAISNGRLVSDTPGPSASRHTLTFATTPKMSSYLLALAVGDFECLTGAADGIPIRVCATPDRKPLGRFALESAEYVLHYYDTYYATKYPFEKLDMVAVPDFAAGAMENTAAIFYRDTDLLVDSETASVGALKNVASAVAHEMAHQWFGDLVTMRWWDDLWLNEGFATWMESRPLAAWKPEWHMDVDQALATQRAIELDSLQSTHAIRSRVETPAEIDESFDTIAYEKGAAIVRMIESYVGPDTFRSGVNAYLAAHAYGNATSEDFAAAIASASGKPVEQILPTFVNQPGVPLVGVSFACPSPGAVTPFDLGTITQRRFFLDPALMARTSSPLWRIPICFKGETGAIACDIRSTAKVDYVDGPCPAVGLFANARALGYYRTEYSSEPLRAIESRLETALSAAERVSLAGDEWALVRGGRQSIADFLALAASFGRESSSGVLGEVTAGLTFAHDYLTTSADKGAYEAFIRSVFRPGLDALGPAARPGEADDRRTLRAALIMALGNTGNDPDVVSEARRELELALLGRAALDPTTADAIVTVAAAHGDVKLWDELADAAKHAGSPEERYRYLYALADFDDPALIRRGLDYVLSPEVRTQNTGLLLARFLANPSATSLAWDFLTAHWRELEPRLAIAFADVRVVQATGSFCDTRSHDAVKAFFASHKLGSAARNVDQSLERISNCVELREKQTAVLADWVRNR